MNIFEDPILEDKARRFYGDLCFEIDQSRFTRERDAYNALLETNDISLPLEASLRRHIQHINQYTPQEYRQQEINKIQAIIDTGEYVAIGSTEETRYKEIYDNIINLFTWPSAEELAIRQQEQQTLLDYMQNNPIDDIEPIPLDEEVITEARIMASPLKALAQKLNVFNKG